ncbi:Hypothetical_protein [Hexamita inflata]|uniref:Hypothetical_protein n=1 Tax=Hexamita inflata TaxID=28002 RepID=A0AA86PZ51_9EUKA|nr:Hypothetical protein HINF_LOCUS35216 [Hexamita inflata]
MYTLQQCLKIQHYNFSNTAVQVVSGQVSRNSHFASVLQMKPNTQETDFLSRAAQVLERFNSNQVTPAVYQVMMLRDDEYEQFWSEMRVQSGIPSSELQDFFSNHVAPKFLFKYDSFSQSSSSDAAQTTIQESKGQKFRRSVSRQKSSASDQFRELFANGLATILSRFTLDSFADLSHADICNKVNAYLEHNDKTQFWRTMTEAIEGKSSKQIQDYYAHSFQKAIYTRQLSTEDKALLRQLSQQMAEAKPSQVALEFLGRAAFKDYFKHNVVMYVINLRRTEQ